MDDHHFAGVSFHFFPGNDGKDFTERLICSKDSPMINELIDHYLELYERQFALELIGLEARIWILSGSLWLLIIFSIL